MTAADKETLDNLNTYDLSVNANGGTDIPAPSTIEVSTSGDTISATANGDPWFSFSPVDPSTGDFTEEIRTFSELPADGMVRAVLTGFIGGIDGNSIVQKGYD